MHLSRLPSSPTGIINFRTWQISGSRKGRRERKHQDTLSESQKRDKNTRWRKASLWREERDLARDKTEKDRHMQRQLLELMHKQTVMLENILVLWSHLFPVGCGEPYVLSSSTLLQAPATDSSLHIPTPGEQWILGPNFAPASTSSSFSPRHSTSLGENSRQKPRTCACLDHVSYFGTVMVHKVCIVYIVIYIPLVSHVHCYIQ